MIGKKRKVISVIKIIAIVIALVITQMGLVSCAGDTRDANIVPIKSDIYSTEDYDEAVKVVFECFKGFDGCTLKEIRYIGDKEKKYMQTLAKDYKEDEAIVLITKFDTTSESQNEGFNPDETYEGFEFILTRNKRGTWQHKDHGY